MIALKLNYLIERAIIVFVCLWGNWALYYWLMVLVFDASFATLKLFSPLLVLQICVSLFVFLRVDFRITSTYSSFCFSRRWFSIGAPDRRFYVLSITAMAVAVAVVCAVDHYELSQSALLYNLVWALLLPIALFHVFYFKPSSGEGTVQDEGTEPIIPVLDIVLLILCTAAVAFSLYGSIFPTYDDGFYAGVISSTLANPDLPIQGWDFLLNTSAPFTLHPAYRTVGYEVLIAFCSDLSGIDPLHLYFYIFPTFSIIFWAIAAYLFMRTLGVPYPGFAVTVVLFALLFWNNGLSPGAAFAFLCWGKYLLWLVAAPLLFVFVSVFIRSPSVSTWLLLLLSVSATGIWSSSAVFVTPVCVVLACIVFSSSRKSSLRAAFYVLLSLAPIIFQAIYTLVMLDKAPVGKPWEGFGVAQGMVKVNGEAFGGQSVQVLLLILLLLLPLVVRTIGNSTFQVNVFRICLVGIFTVMAPYLIEVVAFYSGTEILSERFQYSYPMTLLVGIMASVALTHLKPFGGLSTDTRARTVVILLALTFYSVFFGIMEKRYIFGESRQLGEAFRQDFEEAKAARALIPEGAFVATGDMDDILPILPIPPSFIQVKDYLTTHKLFISKKEFKERRHLYSILRDRLPREGENLETSLYWIVATSEELGVTTIVFHTVGGRYRPYIFGAPKAESNPEREKFVVALIARLRGSGYECTATPSGRSTVCNRKPGDTLN